MWMFSVCLWILNVLPFCLQYESEQEYYQDVEETELGSDLHSQWGTVSTVDELLDLLYPEYGLVQHCLRKKALNTQTSIQEEGDSWGNQKKAALYIADSAFDLILDEMQKTLCTPREVLLDVSKEYPESTTNFYLPRCVSVHRCGGCCNSEAFHCVNTSYTYVNKTLIELSMPHMEKTVVMVSFVNHTECECQPKRSPHSVIRRSANTPCPETDSTCAAGFNWNPVTCQCMSEDMSLFSSTQSNPLAEALIDLCGPNKLWNEEHCECVCQNGLTHLSCGEGWRLDEVDCECVCEEQAALEPCPPHQKWDKERCGCVCQADCPKSQPLNPGNCQCECKENANTCLLQGKKFNPETCSCYRLPCRTKNRKCPSGYYYSQYVCHCLPNFMRSYEQY
ncbi:VEGFC factor, partial [Atractosteus spatula]|nr:VEGFC factor [Atractosteus spatula]